MLCQPCTERYLTGIIEGPYQVVSSIGFTQMNAANRRKMCLMLLNVSE